MHFLSFAIQRLSSSSSSSLSSELIQFHHRWSDGSVHSHFHYFELHLPTSASPISIIGIYKARNCCELWLHYLTSTNSLLKLIQHLIYVQYTRNNKILKCVNLHTISLKLENYYATAVRTRGCAPRDLQNLSRFSHFLSI